jgi:predicted porin
MDAVKIGVGLLQRKVETAAATYATPKQTTTWLQAAYTMDKWVYMGGIFSVSETGETKDTKANFIALRATYNFDDQLSSYVTMGYMGNDSVSGYGVSGGGSGTGPIVGQKQTGTMVGMRYRF